MEKSTNAYVMINNVSAKYKGHTKVTHQPTIYYLVFTPNKTSGMLYTQKKYISGTEL
jgi:hypothetical protein